MLDVMDNLYSNNTIPCPIILCQDIKANYNIFSLYEDLISPNFEIIRIGLFLTQFEVGKVNREIEYDNLMPP